MSKGNRTFLPALFVLSALWGSSYVFVEIGDRGFSPAMLTCVRLAIAAPLLMTLAVVRLGRRGLAVATRPARLHLAVIALLSSTLPFLLLAYGEQRVNSSVAAITSASIPIFVAILAIWMPSERPRGMQLPGIILGIGGIAILAEVRSGHGSTHLLGTLAVVLSAFLYAAAYMYAQRFLNGTPALVVAAGSTAIGFALSLPVALTSLPRRAPSVGPWLAVAANAVLITALASVVMWWMIVRFGTARTGLATYCSPLFAVVYGVVALGEPFGLGPLLGLTCVLLGVALASNVLGMRARNLGVEWLRAARLAGRQAVARIEGGYREYPSSLSHRVVADSRKPDGGHTENNRVEVAPPPLVSGSTILETAEEVVPSTTIGAMQAASHRVRRSTD
jgi:drug/metabolite transporter (DMT)-like permease